MIEGTISKSDYVKSGFYYISKKNNADIIYMVVDLTSNKIRCTKRISIHNYPNINDSLLDPLRTLISPSFRYSINPNHLSLLKFKEI